MGTSFGEQCTFLQEKPKFPKETYVLNLFVITIMSFFKKYVIATYHWKGFKESYNFVGENISIKIYMQKSQSNKIFNKFIPQGKKKGLSCSLGQLKLLFLGDMIIP